VIAGVVLAAGMARRFGAAKVIERFEGRALVRHVVDRLIAARISPIVVVAGDFREEITAALEGSDALVRHNPTPSSGLSSSLATGIVALPATTEAFLVALGDQPLIEASTIGALIDAWKRERAAAVVPAYANADWGHPILIDATIREQLLALEGDTGARRVLQSLGERVLRIPVAADAPLDVDTADDLDRLKRRTGGRVGED
jgi:molybdenum cofactor cytidylyltransferase